VSFLNCTCTFDTCLLNVDQSTSQSINQSINIDVILQTEAPLMIKPMLPYMTRSEIHAVMTGGFATIAGGVLAAYIVFGVSVFSSF